MSIIKGDLKKMIGFKTITVKDMDNNELAIDLSQTRFEEITEFIDIPTKALGGKDFKNITSEDISKLNNMQMDWCIKYFQDKCPELAIEDIKMFIVKNKQSLLNELTIAFNIKTRKQLEDETIKIKAEIEKNL